MKQLFLALVLGSSYICTNEFDEFTLKPIVVYGDKLERTAHNFPQSVGTLDDIRLNCEVSQDAISLLNRFANTYTGVRVGRPSFKSATFESTLQSYLFN